MKDLTSCIYGNPMSKKTIKKANKSQKKYLKKYGDDRNKIYHLAPEPIPTLNFIGVQNLVLSDKPLKLEGKPVIIGNIRMGFGHYRISIALASCAHALGYTPYWLDLKSFPTTGGKMISYQNDLYSMGSRLSQVSKLFNKLVWDPLNSEGFRAISYNAVDQKNSELLVPIFHDIPVDTPYVATHVWPSQGAIHAGMSHVVNAVPDNWPMALHLSEGALHTVQTPFAYLGYKKLNGMDKKKDLKPMSEGSLFEVGHYIDDELVKNIPSDVQERKRRASLKMPLRIALSVGGAGAQYKLFKEVVTFLMPYIAKKEVCLFINYGDHLNVEQKLEKDVKGFKEMNQPYFDQYAKFQEMLSSLKDDTCGLYSIYHKNIFEAVYSTNLLMRVIDVLATKPSELAYYPIPKLMLQRVGGHEAYGAIRSSELGDGTFECDTIKETKSMLLSLMNTKDILLHMNDKILEENAKGTYSGGYKVIKLAVEGHL